MNVYFLVEEYNKKLCSDNILLKITSLKLDICKNGEIYFSIYYPEIYNQNQIKKFIKQSIKRLK